MDRFDIMDEEGVTPKASTSLPKAGRNHTAESPVVDILVDRLLDGNFRFTRGLGWVCWDGKRWEVSENGEEKVTEAVRLFARDEEANYRQRAAEAQEELDTVVESIRANAIVGEDDDNPEGRLKYGLQDMNEATRSRLEFLQAEVVRHTFQADIWLNILNAGKIRNIISLAKGNRAVLCDSNDFDQNHDLLNCTNGTVNLETGELHPHSPADLITKIANGDFVPGATSALWTQALEAVHPDIRDWYQVRMGQTVTGYTPDDDSMVISHGGGENGKTAVMTAIKNALNEYAQLVSHKVLINNPGSHSTEMMDFRGARLALLEETPEEGRLNTHQLKTTIGTPEITARRMRRDDVTFKTTHTMWINTNHMPTVDATDHGTWRRLKAMPWVYKFIKPGQTPEKDNERVGDSTIKARMMTDKTLAPAVIAWLVEGAMKWYAAGRIAPVDPPLVEDATREWRSRSDIGYQFATEFLLADPDSFIASPVMNQEFSRFLEEQGKKPWSTTTLNNRLEESLLQAGIQVTATPVKTSKVRKGDVQSKPPLGSLGTGYVVDAPAGKAIRMWRGVRFKTADEKGIVSTDPLDAFQQQLNRL